VRRAGRRTGIVGEVDGSPWKASTTDVTNTAAVAPAVTGRRQRWPQRRVELVEAPIGARVSMSPNSSSTTTAPT
jgi:hypothetical protein